MTSHLSHTNSNIIYMNDFNISCTAAIHCNSVLKRINLSVLRSLKVALDGGTRPGDTLQILPLALAQPPNPRSITSHSVLRGHPSLTHRVGFFRGIHSQKIIIGNAICFLRKYAFQMKNVKYTH